MAFPARAAEALFFFLDKKEPKNQVSKEASLPHRPLPCKSGKTSGCNLFALLSLSQARASAKSYYALPITQPTGFT
jgi:hypothetical protein